MKSCGKWSLNHGLYNTIALIKTDIIEHYLYPGSGLFPSGLKPFFGCTGEILDFTPGNNDSKGWTSFFQVEPPDDSFGNSQVTELNRTTIGEGCSVWNRLYYPIDGPTGYHTGKFNTVKNAYQPLNNQYPQLSHWYIPSMDELAFIAKACNDSTINLQQKIIDANGVVIGDTRINNLNWTTTDIVSNPGPTGVNSPILQANRQYTQSYVWSSTGTWKDGATAEYLQKGTALSSSNDPNINKQFTNAWAIRFDPKTTTDGNSISSYSVSKFHDLEDRLELRLVRMIRCDQRYFNQTSDQQLKNTFWQVPRLTISSVVSGGIPTSRIISGTRIKYNNTNWTFDPQTATIFKNTP
jgi:hypothetical protein